MDGPELNDGWSGYTEVHGSRLTDAEVAQLEADARETAYLEELAEIETMKKWLKRAYATRQIRQARMTEGIKRLNAKVKSIKFRHLGNVIPEYVQQYVPPVVPRGKGNWRETPRKAAKAKGQTFYFSPRPCHRGHKSARYTSTGQCAACLALWTAEKKAKQTEYRSQI